MSETPINHEVWPPHDKGNIPPRCNCGAVLMRPISIQTGECQACRNLHVREVPGYGR
jgi:hypothetical protein